MGRHVKRGKQAEDRVVPQEAGAADRGEDEGRLHRMRAGRGDMRSRRAAQEERLHAQGGPRRLHVHGIALQDHRVRPDHADGEGFFQRYGSLTGKEFVEFLKAACERFGKILMITDGAPQHRSKFVREEIGRLDGVELQFLPPGSERDRGGVAPDETRDPRRAVRPVSAPCAATSTSG